MGTIIVVEDNPVYSTYVCTFLEKNGFQTRSAGSLSSARKLLAGCKEDDIILADLRLPDGESIGLLRQMRDAGMGQPFIVMTDYAEVHTAVESMKLGSADYLPKYWWRTNFYHSYVLYPKSRNGRKRSGHLSSHGKVRRSRTSRRASAW